MMEPKAHVLVVDDERAIRRFLSTVLEAHGYTVSVAQSGQEGLVAVAEKRPDLLILDLGLPDMDGVEVTRHLREWSQVPVVILSVREQEAEKVAALDAGADDYLTKPFGVGELMARMRAALRRVTAPETEPVYRNRGLVIDWEMRWVTVDGADVQLTPTEYDLLRVLANHAGRVVTHTQLLLQVWGSGYEDELHLLRVNISNLRGKLERDAARPAYIVTELGVGYRLLEEG